MKIAVNTRLLLHNRLEGIGYFTLKTLEKVVKTYDDFVEGKFERGVVEDKYSYVATYEEIKENDFNLNIPRYVDTFEEEEPIDMKAVSKEITAIESELEEVQKEMNAYLEKLKF